MGARHKQLVRRGASHTVRATRIIEDRVTKEYVVWHDDAVVKSRL